MNLMSAHHRASLPRIEDAYQVPTESTEKLTPPQAIALQESLLVAANLERDQIAADAYLARALESANEAHASFEPPPDSPGRESESARPSRYRNNEEIDESLEREDCDIWFDRDDFLVKYYNWTLGLALPWSGDISRLIDIYISDRVFAATKYTEDLLHHMQHKKIEMKSLMTLKCYCHSVPHLCACCKYAFDFEKYVIHFTCPPNQIPHFTLSKVPKLSGLSRKACSVKLPQPIIFHRGRKLVTKRQNGISEKKDWKDWLRELQIAFANRLAREVSQKSEQTIRKKKKKLKDYPKYNENEWMKIVRRNYQQEQHLINIDAQLAGQPAIPPKPMTDRKSVV